MSPLGIAAIAIAIGAAGGGGWFTYRWGEAKILKAEASAKESDRLAVQAALRAKQLSEALSAAEDVAKRRNQALILSQREAIDFRNAYEALYASNQIAKVWGDSPIPLDVRCLRRELDKGLPADSSLQCPPKPIRADTGTPPR